MPPLERRRNNDQQIGELTANIANLAAAMTTLQNKVDTLNNKINTGRGIAIGMLLLSGGIGAVSSHFLEAIIKG